MSRGFEIEVPVTWASSKGSVEVVPKPPMPGGGHPIAPPVLKHRPFGPSLIRNPSSFSNSFPCGKTVIRNSSSCSRSCSTTSRSFETLRVSRTPFPAGKSLFAPGGAHAPDSTKTKGLLMLRPSLGPSHPSARRTSRSPHPWRGDMLSSAGR